MSLRNERELANTLAKLARLEARYEALRRESGGDHELREMSMESLAATINQFKEEIARFKAMGPGEHVGRGPGRSRELRNDRELANTREKLRTLEAMYEREREDPCADAHVRTASKRSIKRMINQLKEEIARYEAHVPVGR